MEKVKQFKIYQLGDCETKYAFLSWKTAATDFRFSDYEYVYGGYSDSLEDIYARFNMFHPSDFKGHSLSVSDVVMFGDQYYYCDSIGWENITDVIKRGN